MATPETVFEQIPEACVVDNTLYLIANHEMVKSVAGARYPWGVPISKVNLAYSSCTTGGSMVRGRYKLCAVPENMLGRIGNPYKTDANFIPLTVQTQVYTTAATNIKIVVTVPTHPDSQVKRWLMYRTKVDELGPYYYAGEVDEGTTTFTFDDGDDALPLNDFLDGPYSDDDSTLAGPFIYGRPPVHSYMLHAYGDTMFVFGARPYRKGLATVTVGSTLVTFSEAIIDGGGNTATVTANTTLGIKWTSGLVQQRPPQIITPDVSQRFLGHRFKLDDSGLSYTIASVVSKNSVRLNTAYLAEQNQAAGTTITGAYTIVANQNIVCPSRPGEMEYFCPAEQFSIGESTGTTLRGGISYAGDALLFTEKTIYRVVKGVNPGTHEVYETLSNYGTIAHRSICQTPRGIAFFTGDHIAIYSNQVSTLISEPLGDLLKNSNPDLKEWVMCKVVDNRLYVAFAAEDSVYMDSIVVFDFNTGAWDRWDGLQIVNMQCITSKKGQNRLHIQVPVGNDGYAAHYFTPNAFNDGFGSVYLGGTVQNATATTLTTTGTFPTVGSHGWDLRGMRVKIREGVAADEKRRIIANTSNSLTVGVPWDTVPAVGDEYTVGQIESYFRTGRQSFPDPQTEHVMKDAEMRISYVSLKTTP